MGTSLLAVAKYIYYEDFKPSTKTRKPEGLLARIVNH